MSVLITEVNKDKLYGDYYIRRYDISNADHISFFDAYGKQGGFTDEALIERG